MNNETGKEHDAKPLLSVVKFRTVNLSMININNPDFKNAAKVHDWRNYVPCDWQKNWEQFTQKIAAHEEIGYICPLERAVSSIKGILDARSLAPALREIIQPSTGNGPNWG
jgi:hypothetical protein